VGEAKVEVSSAAIYSKLLELELQLLELQGLLAPLVPHIPAVAAMLDNPAARWKLRRRDAVRADRP